MIVVADAGPLIHLAAIGRLDLIRGISPTILVPEGVFHEVVVAGAGLPGANDVRDAEWIQVVTAERRELVDALLASGLHRGESEAIAVAVERKADLLLLDERQGRLSAQALGLRLIGTVGVLIAAKDRGHIPLLAPLLVELQRSGLWLSQPLIDRVLAAVGEVRVQG